MRPFLDSDLPTLNVWSAAHGCLPMTRSQLPATGFLVPDVAALFLVRTDTEAAFLEAAVTNPSAASADRHAALDELTTVVLAEALRLGFRCVLVLTDNPDVAARAERHGFTRSPGHAILRRAID